jgi:hypothetical protein
MFATLTPNINPQIAASPTAGAAQFLANLSRSEKMMVAV